MGSAQCVLRENALRFRTMKCPENASIQLPEWSVCGIYWRIARSDESDTSRYRVVARFATIQGRIAAEPARTEIRPAVFTWKMHAVGALICDQSLHAEARE